MCLIYTQVTIQDADIFPMIVLSHEPTTGSAPIHLDLRANARAARESGIRVHSLPLELTDPETALGWLQFDKPTLGVLSTYIQREKTYRPLYEEARRRNIYLIHTPEQNSRLMEFELFYPLIHDLTAKSVVVKNKDDLNRAIDTLEFPVFTKGQIKSVKEQGWAACVAETPEDLATRAGKWGEVIAREIMDFRKPDGPMGAFPEGREYRAFWLDGKIIGMEYYWNGHGRTKHDPFGDLTWDEKTQVETLIHDAASRLAAPLVTVDVGQLTTGEWRVVEIGDPQYSGICHMPRHLLWERIKEYSQTWTTDI